MITVVLLHLNRLFLIDVNIKILRYYYGDKIRICVADDGSSKDFVKFLEKCDIDNIFVSSKNVNGERNGSCSKVLARAVNSVDTDFYLFSEDDFFLSSAPVVWHGKGAPNPGELVPDLHYQDTLKYNILQEAVKVLIDHEDIKQIQLARDSLHDDNIKTVPICPESKWHYIRYMSKYYHCNWPYIMRTKDIQSIKIPKGLSITGVENNYQSLMVRKFGRKNWACCPVPSYYLHMGRGFSNMFKFSGNKKRHSINVQNVLGIPHKDYKKVNIELSKRYMLCPISMQTILNNGISQAYMKVFV